jgi:hypothetical protein
MAHSLIRGRKDKESQCVLFGAIDSALSVCFLSTGNFDRGGLKRPLRLCGGGTWDHPNSGKNQAKLRTYQSQVTLAHGRSGLRAKREIPYAQFRRRQPGLQLLGASSSFEKCAASDI